MVTQERLRDELRSTGTGQVHTTQDAYRRAVDEAMFKLGEERYAALVDLLANDVDPAGGRIGARSRLSSMAVGPRSDPLRPRT